MRQWRDWVRPEALLLLGVYALMVYSVFKSAAAFVPDTRYYAAMALRFSGSSQQDAVNAVAVFTQQFGWDTPSADQLFSWGLVAPRVVYPLLSAPFVAVWGIPGLQVVPVVAMGAGLFLTQRLGRRLAVGTAVLAALLLLTVSTRMVFYGGAMLTESLAFALVSAMAMCLPWGGRRRPRRALVVSLALMLVLAFTRQTTLIPAGAVLAAWVFSAIRERSVRTVWAPFALWWTVAAVGLQLLQTILFPGFSQAGQFQKATGTDSLAHALAAAPRLAWKIIQSDVNVMMAKDRPLLALLSLALLAGVVRWRHADAHLLLGAVAATFVYNITNGTPTVFRYGMPGLCFVVLAVALLLQSAVDQRLTPLSAKDPGSTDEEVENRRERDDERLGHQERDSEAREQSHATEGE